MKGFLRPDARVLPDDALIPSENLIQPPPNQFTHRLKGDAPFYWDTATQQEPAGSLAAGSHVALLVRDGTYARVVDARGLYVTVDAATLEEL